MDSPRPRQKKVKAVTFITGISAPTCTQELNTCWEKHLPLVTHNNQAPSSASNWGNTQRSLGKDPLAPPQLDALPPSSPPSQNGDMMSERFPHLICASFYPSSRDGAEKRGPPRAQPPYPTIYHQLPLPFLSSLRPFLPISLPYFPSPKSKNWACQCP